MDFLQQLDWQIVLRIVEVIIVGIGVRYVAKNINIGKTERTHKVIIGY